MEVEHLSKEKSNKLAFREFLDKSTNLITIFGVLNALVIYSSTHSIANASKVLPPCFFILSTWVWLEIIGLAVSSYNNSIKYIFFFLLAILIQIGLVILFVDLYKVLTGSTILIIIVLGLFALAGWITLRLYLKRLKKRKGKRTLLDEILFYAIMILLILSSFQLLSELEEFGKKKFPDYFLELTEKNSTH